jgi:hypothetical protein
MRRSLELGLVIVVVLLAVIISLAVQKSPSPSAAKILNSVPQVCTAGSGSPGCWTVTATPRDGVAKSSLSKFLSSVWNTNGAGVVSVLGSFELQRCGTTGVGSSYECTLWSTGSKSDVQALEAQFIGSNLFKNVATARS